MFFILQWEWEGMGIRSWEWEGMESKKSFQQISNSDYHKMQMQCTLFLYRYSVYYYFADCVHYYYADIMYMIIMLI